ncbi:lipid-A-disaccharide synthase [Sanyastnella coralliicola]|uniref:lipid-A-disaccharide synthase n=1 Tax=Sanyastnella coralliicola TaxID=3069118 RepID=UPI0027B8C5D3|nr:lipid-A-disaccharide synthase [Longitalea sp. SCSIO 12813]
MKYYVIAGEASGDLHASNLMKAIAERDASPSFRAWGGDLMEEQGATLVKHYKDLAFMGFIEVLMNIRTILGNIKLCKEDILEYAPDAVILVDYPGFNLRIATFCREQGIPVYYYISPQVWAWKEGRVKRIKQDVTRMLTILPFEKDFYKGHGMEVDFVGHPLLDVIGKEEHSKSLSIETPGKEIIALLPGSRKQEISTMLPVMLEVAKRFPEYEFVVAGAPGQSPSFYEQFKSISDFNIVFGETYALFQKAKAGLVTSGTATLEAALHGMPQAVCYKGSSISYQIAKRLVKIKYISLVNLIMDKEVVRELIQGEMNTDLISKELSSLLDPNGKRQELLKGYAQLKEKLGGGGASGEAATIIVDDLKNKIQN